VQTALWADMATKVRVLAQQYLPEVRGVLTDTAGSLNNVADGIFNYTQHSNALESVRTIFSNTRQTMVELELEYEPEGVIETVADKVGLVERRAKGDLERFKAFIEDAGYASGAWRGTVPGAVGTPGVEAAATSKGDSGGAGVAKKVVAGAAVAAAAGVAAAAKAKSGGSDTETAAESEREIVFVETELRSPTR